MLKKLNCEKILLIQMWIQMALTPSVNIGSWKGVEILDVKGKT
jgi:hypothetical protein